MSIMRQEISLLMGQLGWTDVNKAGPDSLIDLLDPRAGKN
jgi:L-lactate dehydrogenase (cytochrome)/(S)-mandelate dehydrogenase